MSLFNLDRFRFQRGEGTSSTPKLKKSELSSDSTSPNSDKENKPGKTGYPAIDVATQPKATSTLHNWTDMLLCFHCLSS